MLSSTMVLPEQHLSLIQAHQRELQAEVERLAAGRVAAARPHAVAAWDGVLTQDVQQLGVQRDATLRRRSAVLWWWLSTSLVSMRMRVRSLP